MKMIKWIISLCLMLALFAFAADPVAVVIKNRGKVFVTPRDGAKPQLVKRGRVLFDGNKLQTYDGAFCALKFLDDKSLLRMKENSSCIIEGKKQADHIDKNIVVEVGSFFASLFKQRGRFTVTTPTSVASVKGTKFWTIQNGPNGTTMFIGMEGLVDLLNDAGRVLLRSGQTVIYTSKNKLPEIRITNEGDVPPVDDAEKFRSLEIEFKDATGQVKKLHMDYKEK